MPDEAAQAAQAVSVGAAEAREAAATAAGVVNGEAIADTMAVAEGEQWMQQQLACQKQELLLLETEAKRQWEMHERAVSSQLQLGQVTQGQQHQDMSQLSGH